MGLTIHADNGKAEEMIQEITLFVGRIAAGIFGAVAGAILTALLVWTLCRFTVRRQPPRPVNRMLRMLGGLAGAIAAILFLPIGYGGFGLGSGGLGLGPGGGGFKPSDARQAASLSGIDPKESQPPPRIAVVMLGGSLVRGEAFYRFDDDPTPHTLAEIQSKLRRREHRPPAGTRRRDLFRGQLGTADARCSGSLSGPNKRASA